MYSRIWLHYHLTPHAFAIAVFLLGNRHVARLQTGSCSIEYGFVLEDLLTNYERVCDHCSNVAVAQIEVAQDSFDTHAYLNDLRHGNDTKESEEFHRRLDRYRERYCSRTDRLLRRIEL